MSKILLLTGSPRFERSTSASLGEYLLSRLEEKGAQVETLHICQLIGTGEGVERLIATASNADVIILSFPLYFYTLPSGTIRALEVLSERETLRGKSLVAVANCGFPESRHNEPAILTCRKFAERAGMLWLGGLSTGCGPAIDGKPLKEAGGMVKNTIKALDIAAEDVFAGRTVSPQASQLMARQLMPGWIYRVMGNMGWRILGRSLKKTGRDFRDKPLLD